MLEIDAIGFVEGWCADLESGEYAQGTCSLRVPLGRQAEHCCLGVAGERWNRLFPWDAILLDHESFLPEHVWQAITANVDEADLAEHGVGQDDLGIYNDDGLKFVWIAERIREDLLPLIRGRVSDDDRA